MQYQVLEKKRAPCRAISKTLRKSKALYLATDPDREGRAIACTSRKSSRSGVISLARTYTV